MIVKVQAPRAASWLAARMVLLAAAFAPALGHGEEKPPPVGFLKHPRGRVERALTCQYQMNSEWGTVGEYQRCDALEREERSRDVLSRAAAWSRTRNARFCLPPAYRDWRLFFFSGSWGNAIAGRHAARKDPPARSRRLLGVVQWLEAWMEANDPRASLEERRSSAYELVPAFWTDPVGYRLVPGEDFPRNLGPSDGLLESLGGLPALPPSTRRRLVDLAYVLEEGQILRDVLMREVFVPEPSIRELAEARFQQLRDERKWPPPSKIWDLPEDLPGVFRRARGNRAPDSPVMEEMSSPRALDGGVGHGAVEGAPEPSASAAPGLRVARGTLKPAPAGFLAEPTSRDEQVLRCQYLAGALNEREAAACRNLETEERELDPLAALAADFRRRELLECLPEELQSTRLYKPFARDAYDKAVKEARRGSGHPLFRFALWYDDWYRASDDRRPRWDRREALWGLFPAWRKMAGEATAEVPTPMTAKELARMHGPLAPVGGIPAIPTETRRRLIELAAELGNETVLVEVFMRPELTPEHGLRELAAKLRGRLAAKRTATPPPADPAPAAGTP